MRILFTIYLFTVSFCQAGYDEAIEAKIGGWTIHVETFGGNGENRDEVLARVNIRHPNHKGDADMTIPLDAFYTLWAHLSRLEPSRTFTEEINLRDASECVVLSTHNHKLFKSRDAVSLMRLWLDCYRDRWVTPKNEDLIEEAQGPQHAVLQTLLRKGLFPPDIADIQKAQQDGADQPATAPESKSEGKDKPQPESEQRPR
jgi:hypothetical protein